MPTLVQLQYAMAIESHRHFGRASKACHVTQPTLSQQLQKLEDEIDVILFDRTKKPILPTPEGQIFLEQAKIVIRESEKLLHLSKKDHIGQVHGDFRLGVIPTISSYLLPLFLKAFARTYPNVVLFIEEMKTEAILDALTSDQLDGAILATPIPRNDFKIHPLYYEPFYGYFSEGHELLNYSRVDKNQLDVNRMWLLQDGHCFKDQILNFCALPPSISSRKINKNHSSNAISRAHHMTRTALQTRTALRAENLPNNIRFQSGSLDTLRRLILSNQGYTLIPALMLLSLSKEEQEAHVRAFKSPVPIREISMIYRRDHWKLDIIRALEKTISKHLPSTVKNEPEKNQNILEIISKN